MDLNFFWFTSRQLLDIKLKAVSYNLNDVCYDLNALYIFASFFARLLIGIKSIIQTYVGDRK